MDNGLVISAAGEREVDSCNVEQFFGSEDVGEGAEKCRKVTKYLKLLDNTLYAHENEMRWFYDNVRL